MNTDKPNDTLRPIVYNAPPTHLLSPQFRFTPSGTDIRKSSFERAWAAINAAGGQRLVTTEEK